MAGVRKHEDPGYVRALIVLLLGLAITWLVTTATADTSPLPAETRNQQSALCSNLLRLWVSFQQLSGNLTPDATKAAIQERRTGVSESLRGTIAAYTEVIEGYVTVAVFLFGLILGLLGIILLIRAVLRTAQNFRHRETKYQSRRERALRRWFAHKSPRLRTAVIPLLVGVLLALAAIRVRQNDPPWVELLCSSVNWLCFGANASSLLNTYLPLLVLAVGVLIALLGLVRSARMFVFWLRIPSDKKVKMWFDESKESLKKEALRALGLYESELATRQPLVIMSEILEPERDLDIADDDIVYKVARDETLYCGAYVATIMYFTQHHVATYRAEYSFIRGEAMDEDTFESNYEDIVILSTTQRSFTKLDTGDKIKWAEQFRLSYPSGESVPVWVSNNDIFLITGGSRLPATDAEQAISVIRAKMRDVKRSADQPR